MYDPELILSWTPKEYENFIIGAQHKQIDEYVFMAKTAMANRYAQNAKRPSEKKIFDAKKARKKLETGQDYDVEHIKRMAEMNKKLKDFKPNFIPKRKGGK